jgi:hypothetical protein
MKGPKVCLFSLSLFVSLQLQQVVKHQMNFEFALEIWEQTKAPGQKDRKIIWHSERQQPPDEMWRNDLGRLQCLMTAKVWQHRTGSA